MIIFEGNARKKNATIMKHKLLALLFLLVSFPFFAQWQPQISGTTANLNDVYCLTENLVVIVGNGGTILKTTDGGANWISKTSGTTSDLREVQFVNSNIGYAVGSGGVLLKTTDGGEIWNAITTGFTTNLYGLSCVNETIVFISGDNGLIKKTTDGGVTFTDQSIPSVYPFVTIQFLNEQVGYASSYDPPPYGNTNSNTKFIKTTDGGITWNLVPNQNISSFYFLTENIGFLRDNNGVSKTIDGGLNQEYIGNSGQTTVAIFSSNENVVWNVENTFTLCNCSIFCINKIDLTLAPELQQVSNCYSDTTGDSPFMSIHFGSETKGYAVGLWGKILKNSTGLMDNVFATTEFNKENFVKMYPNPATNQITISFKEKQSTPFSIEITDFVGKKIISKSFENQNDTTLPIESFSKGIYFVKISTKKGESIQKIIKE